MVSKEYAATKNKNKYWSTLGNKGIPPQNLAEAFPVNDPSDPNDIYLIYSAIPKIAKYNLSGEKIWEHKIPRMPEVDSLIINLSIHAKVEKTILKFNASLIPVRTYVAGRCSPDGDLYLTTYTDPAMPDKYHRPLWIHQFTSKGKLIKRYKIVSDGDEVYYPAIDFERHRIFIALLRNAHIKTYYF